MKNKILCLAATLLVLFAVLPNVVNAQDPWVVDIDGHKYLMSEFLARYYTFIETSAPEDQWAKLKADKKNMKDYVQIFINETILWMKITDEKFVQNNSRLLNFLKQMSINNLYIDKVLRLQMKAPTDDEIAQFYDAHKDQFKNVSIDQAEKQISGYLTQTKLQQFIQDKIAKIKETLTIIRNPDYYEKNLKTDWVLKIGKDVIKYDDFNGLYQDYKATKAGTPEGDMMNQQPGLVLDQFTTNFINQFLIYNYEVKKTDFEKKYAKHIDYLYQSQAIQLFVTTKLKGTFKPVSQDQIIAFYNSNKAQFANITPEQAYQQISQYLNAQLTQMLMSNLVSRYRDEHIIKTNTDLDFMK